MYIVAVDAGARCSDRVELDFRRFSCAGHRRRKRSEEKQGQQGKGECQQCNADMQTIGGSTLNIEIFTGLCLSVACMAFCVCILPSCPMPPLTY